MTKSHDGGERHTFSWKRLAKKKRWNRWLKKSDTNCPTSHNAFCNQWILVNCGSDGLKWIFDIMKKITNKCSVIKFCHFYDVCISKDTDFQCIRLAEFIRMVGTLSGSQRRAILWKNEKFVNKTNKKNSQIPMY